MDYTGLINVQARAELSALKLSGDQLRAWASSMDAGLQKMMATPPIANLAAKALRDVGVAAADAARVAGAMRGVGAQQGPAVPNTVQLAQNVAAMRASIASTVASIGAIPRTLAATGPRIAAMGAQIRAAFNPAMVTNLRTQIANGLAGAAIQAGRVMQQALIAPFALARNAANGAIQAVKGIGAALMQNLGPAAMQAKAISASRTAALGVVAAVKGIGTALAGLATAAAVGMTLFNVNAIQNARTFQDELAKINTIARATPDELTAIGDSLRSLAGATGEPLYEITDSFYDLLSAGLTVSDSMAVVKQSATLAVGGLGDIKGSVDLMTSAWNAFKLDEDTATQAMDVFAAAVERGKLRIDDIGETFSTVAPLAFSLGIEVEEVGAAYAALTGQGFTAGEAMTAMRSSMIGLQRQNKELQLATQKTGIDFVALAKEKGLQVSMSELRKYSEEAGVPLIKLLGRIEGVQYALSTTGSNAEYFNKQLDYMYEASGKGGVAQGLMDRRMQSFDRSVKQMQQSFKDLAIEWGTALLPPLTKVVQTINTGLQAVNKWSKENRELIATIAPVVTALTTFVGLRVGIGALLTMIPNLTGAFTALGIGTGSAFGAIAAVAAPVIAVVGALGALYYAIDNNIAGLGVFKDVVEPLEEAVGTLVETFQTLLSGGQVDFGAMFADIGASIGKSLDAVGSHIEELGPKVMAELGNVGDTIIQTVIAWVPQIADAGRQLFEGAGDWIRDNLPNVGTGLANLVSSVIDWIRGAVPQIAEAVRGWVSSFIAWIPQGISTLLDMLGGLVQGIVNFVTSGDNISKIAQSLVEWGTAFLIWIPGAIADLLSKLPDIIGAILGFIIENGPVIIGGAINIGLQLIAGIVAGLQSVAGQVVDAVIGAVQGAVRGFVSLIIGTIRNIIGIISDIPGPWQEMADEMEETLNGIQRDVDAWGKDVQDSTSQTGALVRDNWREDMLGVPAATEKAATLTTAELNALVAKTDAELRAGSPAIEQASQFMFDPIPTEADAAAGEAVAVAAQTPSDIASALRNGYSDVESGMDRLKEAMKKPMTTAKRIAKLEAQLTGKALANGLKSSDPVVRAEAEALKTAIQDQIKTLEETAKLYGLHTGKNFTDNMMVKLTTAMTDPAIGRVAAIQGQLAGDELKKGLKSKDKLVREAAQQYKKFLEEELKKASEAAEGYGEKTGQAYGQGLASQQEYIKRKARLALKGAREVLEAGSPPGPESPLHEIDKWAARTGQAYAVGLASTGPQVATAARIMVGGAAAQVASFRIRGPESAKGTWFGAATSTIPPGMAEDRRREQDLLEQIAKELGIQTRLQGKMAATEPKRTPEMSSRSALAQAVSLRLGA